MIIAQKLVKSKHSEAVIGFVCKLASGSLRVQRIFKIVDDTSQVSFVADIGIAFVAVNKKLMENIILRHGYAGSLEQKCQYQ